MYVVTFYSFKGGVGRTLALVNIAAHLALRGKRVLIVDFDLEAPGLSSFNGLQPRQPCAGVVEFVSDYIQQGESPDLQHYVYHVSQLGGRAVNLWVMPAGKQDEDYNRKLEAIDWRDLYTNHHGYLFFEDFKAQCREDLKLDYLFIDSRTGYTDVAGICTRQLPDAVVILFFPNLENLRGLKTVVTQLRRARQEQAARSMAIHFVLSNVPDLDDEERILQKRIEQFKRQLGFRELDAVIHRYDSFALLNQIIFVVERPRSRLSKEYRKLANVIIKQNLQDREVALRLLEESRDSSLPIDLGNVFASFKKFRRLHERIDRILNFHATDTQVLLRAADIMAREGRLEDALGIVSRILELAPDTIQAVLLRATILQLLHRTGETLRDLLDVLRRPTLTFSQLKKAVGMLREVDPPSFVTLLEAPSIQQCREGELAVLYDDLNWHDEGQFVFVQLAQKVLAKPTASEEGRCLRGMLSLALIALGNYEEAKKLIASQHPSVEQMPIEDTFNYAMADWAQTGIPSKSLFTRVADLDRSSAEGTLRTDANYAQCLAVTYYLLGDRSRGLELLTAAEESLNTWSRSEFSCWRYKQVTPRDFLADCVEIRRWISGEDIRPKFFRDEPLTLETFSGSTVALPNGD